MDWKIKPAEKIKGEVIVPPDKSISHRAIMFGAISNGMTRVKNFLHGEDCLHTLKAFQSLGVDIRIENNVVLVNGRGLKGLTPPEGPIYLGNSGTSMRIISGILAGQDFRVVLTGDESLAKRPMGRVIDPLRLMGAHIEPQGGAEYAPLEMGGISGDLMPIDYSTPVASAQVKSCILAAGLYADGMTSVTEPFQSRDHTERMLKYFSADIDKQELTTKVKGLKELEARDVEVPGDISSAAFFIVAALLLESSQVLLRNVGLNATRRGIIDVLKRMGARIDINEIKDDLEPSADLVISYSNLTGTVVESEEIPLLIDEIPVLVVAAAMADGKTEIKGIAELKVKETDRVKSIQENLTRMGVEILIEGESLIVQGGTKKFNSAILDSAGDHRIAMSMSIAALNADGECLIRDTDCVSTSYPTFMADLISVTQ